MSSVIECSCMLHYSYHFLLSSTDSKAQSNHCLLWLQTTAQSARSASPVKPPAHPPLHQHQPGRRRRGGRAGNAILQVTTISSAFTCRYNQREGSRTRALRALQPTAKRCCQRHAAASCLLVFMPTFRARAAAPTSTFVADNYPERTECFSCEAQRPPATPPTPAVAAAPTRWACSACDFDDNYTGRTECRS